MIKRHFVDSRFGQVHLRAQISNGSDKPPLVLLHPMPYSGLYFTTLMPLFGRDRSIIAPDYPGCGASDAMSSPSIEGYAAAVLDALRGFGIDGECDFLGFHTGCLVAAEIAVAKPQSVASVILVDIPYFDDAKRAALRASMTTHKALTEDLSCLQHHWDTDVKPRLGTMPLARAVQLFTDHVAAEGDGADGFKAAFDHPIETSFRSVTAPTLVLATASSLRDATLAAAQLINGAEVIELTDITRAVCEEGAPRLAEEASRWLDS